MAEEKKTAETNPSLTAGLEQIETLAHQSALIVASYWNALREEGMDKMTAMALTEQFQIEFFIHVLFKQTPSK